MNNSDVANMINTLCYTMGLMFGTQADSIWHNFDKVCAEINSNSLQDILD